MFSNVLNKRLRLKILHKNYLLHLNKPLMHFSAKPIYKFIKGDCWNENRTHRTIFNQIETTTCGEKAVLLNEILGAICINAFMHKIQLLNF